MIVATTRKPASDPGLLYTGDRGNAISVNRLVVSIPPERNRKVGEVQWPSRIPADPEREFAVAGEYRVQSEPQLHDWFRKNRNAKRQVLIFVHGFNNTYADAVFRFAQIVHDSKTDAAPVLFTWPSRASVFGYFYDKESTNYSRRALEDLIIQTAQSPDVGDITILAHSMGAWLTAEALRGVAMRDKAIPAKVRNVVLASPDIDVDVFRRQFIEMGPHRPHFTVFISSRDKALGFSRWISGGVDRVGSVSVNAADYAVALRQIGVLVIDTSAVASNDPLDHNAFADSPELVQALGRRIAGQGLEGGEVTFGDRVGLATIGAANLAGSVTRAAVAAPMAIVSQDARAVLREELSPSGIRLINGQISY